MHRLYIGSPNETKVHDEETISSIVALVSEYFESFTFSKARGVFRGVEEDTLVVVIAGARDSEVVELAEKLRVLLNQDGVGIEHNETYWRVTA